MDDEEGAVSDGCLVCKEPFSSHNAVRLCEHVLVVAQLNPDGGDEDVRVMMKQAEAEWQRIYAQLRADD